MKKLNTTKTKTATTCYNMFMPNEPSKNDIPNRISANFFALIGFANFVILLGCIGSNFEIDIVVGLIMIYAFCIYLFGVVSIASIPMIFPLFFLLRTNNKKISNILAFMTITFFIVILCILYSLFIPSTNILNTIDVYKHFYIFCLYLPSLFAFHIVDKKQKFSLKNTTLLNNNFYKNFVKIFYYFFWSLYIPFFVALLYFIL